MSQVAAPLLDRAPAPLRPDTAGWRRWAGGLFRSTPAQPISWRGWLLAVAGVVVGTLVSVLRQGGRGGFDTMWAEDGKIFLADAANKSFLSALVTPYNGYYQAVPRLLAEPVLLFPASWAAAFYTIEASFVTALFALVVYVASGAHLHSRLARLLAASITVASPLAVTGIPVSLCNVHWPGLCALFWVLLWVPQSRTGRIVSLVLCALLPATNILAVIFVPLAVVRAAVVRGWLSKAMAALVTLGVILHLYGLATGSTSRPLHPTIWGAVSSFITRTVPSTMIGEAGLHYHGPTHRGLAATALGWLVLLAVVVVAGLGLTRPTWTVAALAGLYSALLWGAAVSSTGLLATRYAAAAGMLLFGGIAALLVPGRGVRGVLPVLAALALVIGLYGLNLRADYRNAQGPSWTAEIHTARVACAQPGVRSVDVVIAPPLEGWYAHLPCSYVER